MLFLILAILSTWIALAGFGVVSKNTGIQDWIIDRGEHRAAIIKGFLVSTVLALWLLSLVAFFGTAGDLKGIAIVVLAIWLAIPVLVTRVILPLLDRDEHGSARFMTPRETDQWTEANNKPAGLLLGRDTKSRDVRYAGEAHLITVAPNRSGKGVGAIIPNLLTYSGSVLVVDPKGENARVAARRRAEIGKTYVLDPFGTTGLSTASYNPLSRITANNPDAADDAAALADALVVRSPDDDSHWDDEAASFLEGVILFVALHEARDRQHLGTVREIITETPERFNQILEVMQDCGGLVARTANRFLGKSDREASSVLSTAQRHTKFLDSERMTRVLGTAAGLSFSELKKNQGTTIFLCIPPDRLDTYGRWLRLMVNEALQDMASTDRKPDLPVLFLLDEFAALGQLQTVKRAMGLMAGYGMRLWPFLQDLSQLKATYGDVAQTFFANAGAVQWFGVNDIETAKQISETIGQQTVVMREGDGDTSSHARSLLTPDELMNLPNETQILMFQGKRPLACQKLRYFDDPAFSGMWDIDPQR